MHPVCHHAPHRHLPHPGPAGEVGTAARASAALAYHELGWPVRVRGDQLSLNLDLDLDAVALVIPAPLAARVAQILAGRRCPPVGVHWLPAPCCSRPP